MTPGSLAFLVVAAVAIFVLPRRSAVIPLLLAAAYTTRLPVVEIGPANLSVLRVLVLVGLIRVGVRGERMANGVNAVDGLLFAWAFILVGMSLFHIRDTWTFRGGLVLGEIGTYVLCRIFIRDADEVRQVFRTLCLALLPLAALMLIEKFTAHNYFAIMGASPNVILREGHIRAAGAFAHPILAGMVGAACVPMSLCLWRTDRLRSLLGLCAGLGIVFASTASGPIMMTVFACVALALWSVRGWLSAIRWSTVAAIIALQIVMKDPVYFLMARIDLTGSSTGWHRAQLIRSSLAHLDEWWIAGTDYTRHWMATGIYANEFHTDITNHLLGMGVMGGLPLVTVFLFVLIAAFRAVGRALKASEGQSLEHRFLIWALGATLFAHVMNFWSISLFDQSVSFVYLVLAAIGAVQTPMAAAATASLSPVAARPAPPLSSARAHVLAVAGRQRNSATYRGRTHWSHQ